MSKNLDPRLTSHHNLRVGCADRHPAIDWDFLRWHRCYGAFLVTTGAPNTTRVAELCGALLLSQRLVLGNRFCPFCAPRFREDESTYRSFGDRDAPDRVGGLRPSASAAWIWYSPSLEFCYFDYFSGTARCRPLR
jgi:hypothetical protein